MTVRNYTVIGLLMIKVLIIQSICYSTICSQSIHGTFLIATKCKDGLLLISDSRFAYGTAFEGLILYSDTYKKVLQWGDFAVGVSGTIQGHHLANHFLSQIDSSSVSSPNQFMHELNKIIAASTSRKEWHDVMWFAIGKSFKNYQISWLRSGKVDVGSVAINQADFLSSGELRSFYTIPHTETISIIKSLLPNYIEKADKHFKIGGPYQIFFLEFGTTKPRCLEGCEISEYNSKKHMLQSILSSGNYVPLNNKSHEEIETIINKFLH